MAALFTYQPWLCKNFKVNFEKVDKKKIIKVE